MAVGDWVPGTTLRPGLVNITFDLATGRVNHVGIGYTLIGPSGEFLKDTGYTWQPTPAEQDQMDALGAQLVADTLAHEGVSLWSPPPPAPLVPPAI